MLYKIYPDSPDQRKIKQIVDILEKGGVIIYPTDTVYAFGCSLLNKRAIERLAKLKDSKMKHANFSIVFYDLSSLADYTKAIDRPTYKILNKNLPGPFTFILEASARIPKLFETNKKTVGIRIPDNKIVMEIVRELGHPLVTGSLHDEDAILDYSTDPDMIFEKWNNMVDAIIDGGFGKKEPSTVVDLSGDEMVLIRQGVGELKL
jgi:tRNA threonylcarbamoyl adenosine modification protein (Sua5/YciO/YrdC/YwlC family)